MRHQSPTLLEPLPRAMSRTPRAISSRSSATLVILLKKSEEEMAAMRTSLGEAYLQPYRPLGMGGTLTKLAAVCVLGVVAAAVGVATGPHQFTVNAKGGCDLIQWVL